MGSFCKSAKLTFFVKQEGDPKTWLSSTASPDTWTVIFWRVSCMFLSFHDYSCCYTSRLLQLLAGNATFLLALLAWIYSMPVSRVVFLKLKIATVLLKTLPSSFCLQEKAKFLAVYKWYFIILSWSLLLACIHMFPKTCVFITHKSASVIIQNGLSFPNLSTTIISD